MGVRFNLLSAESASKKKESPTTGKKGTTSDAEKTEDFVVDVTPRTLGTCTLDLIPLFLGSFSSKEINLN